jgi:hypothetical protein
MEQRMHTRPIAAMAAVAQNPQLFAQVDSAIAAQEYRFVERTTHAVPRPDQIAAIEEALASVSGGVIAIEGAPGSGITTLLCQFAASHPSALWLPSDDAGLGYEALCAQIIALAQLPVPLVPPAAGRDSTALERLLTEAMASRTSEDPLLLLIDDRHGCRARPYSPPFPLTLPDNVVVLAGITPGAKLPLRPIMRLSLPTAGEHLHAQLAQVATMAGYAPEAAERIAAYADGSFLYVRLVLGLVASAQIDMNALPVGLPDLLLHWWQHLDHTDRRLFALYAVAGEPFGVQHIAALINMDTAQIEDRLARWQCFFEDIAGRALLCHTAIHDLIAHHAPAELAHAHAQLARLLQQPDGIGHGFVPQGYLIDHAARHIALSDAQTRVELGPALEQRAWIIAQERRTSSMRAAANDLMWSLSAAKDAVVLRLIRVAALAGTLTLLARSIAPDAIGAALFATIEAGGTREPALRRARTLVDQLPNGRDKALALRRLGEICYTLRMRAPAMRMLSEALDLETQGLPRSWRDEREETMVALARAAIAAGASDTALGITTLITHPERRGLIDTEVVRHLLANGEYTRAEEVAYAITHLSAHEWAMAEVAVGQARAGDQSRADEVLATLRTATAAAWVVSELASDAARSGDSAATARVRVIQNAALRDRALAQIVQAFAISHRLADALAAASEIDDVQIRARALATAAEANPGHAEQLLAEAARTALAITGEEQLAFLALLAATHAAVGWLDHAMQTAEQLPLGEERDRAQARIAVALARRGDNLSAHTIALGIQDDDERAWALDELARQIAASGQWQSAFGLAAQIADTNQRAHTEADLAIAWARAGDPGAAHQHADQIVNAAERVRALALIVGPLVAAGLRNLVPIAAARTPTIELRSRYQSAAATALANNGLLEQAAAQITQIGRPIERARALVALTRAAAISHRPQALHALADAFQQVARLGRSETLNGIAWAADALILLDRPELLLSVAGAIDELDGWWK